MAHPRSCENAEKPECECRCHGLLHGGDDPFKFKWDGGSTWLRNGTPDESLAVITFDESLSNDDRLKWAKNIGELLRQILADTGEPVTPERIGQATRLAAEHHRIYRHPRTAGELLPAPGRQSLRLDGSPSDGPDGLGRDYANFARILSLQDDYLELALILAMPDLTDNGLGNSAFAADQTLVLNALLSGCRARRGGPRERPTRRGPRSDGVRAKRQVVERADFAIESLPTLERQAVKAAVASDTHFLCTIATLSAKALDLPNDFVSGASSWLVKQVVESFFDEDASSDPALQLAVYGGGLVVSQLLGTVVQTALGTAALPPAAQLSRVIAFALCPAPSEHPLVADTARQFFRTELEDVAVTKLFGWFDHLATAA